jgi:hypothetical protein
MPQTAAAASSKNGEWFFLWSFICLEANEIAWNFPSWSTCVRIAPSPPGVSAVPVAASVINAYCRSVRGKAITSSDTSCFRRLINASMAGSGSSTPFYPESFLVSLKSGVAMTAKSLMCIGKKLHSPTKEQIVLTSLGALAL